MNEWKREYKELDKLEKRDLLKERYSKGNWSLLENVKDFKKEDFNKILPELSKPKEIYSFLLECSKEAISDSRHYVKIMIDYLNLDTKNRD